MLEDDKCCGNKVEQGKGDGRWGEIAVVNRVARLGVLEKVTFVQEVRG